MPTTKRPEAIAIVPAGGSGVRFGGKKSKLLTSVAGKPALQWTIQTLLRAYSFDQIIIPCPPHDREQFRFLTELSPLVTLTEGGASRAESVRNGLGLIDEAKDPLVVIHDGARCGISKTLISEVIAEAAKGGAACLALPVTDTVKQKQADSIATIDRSHLWQMQTPQVFRASLLRLGYQKHPDLSMITDDAMLIEDWHPIALVKGSRMNIKLTTPEDVILLESVLLPRG